MISARMEAVLARIDFTSTPFSCSFDLRGTSLGVPVIFMNNLGRVSARGYHQPTAGGATSLKVYPNGSSSRNLPAVREFAPRSCHESRAVRSIMEEPSSLSLHDLHSW